MAQISLCLKAVNRKYICDMSDLHFIVHEKVKILHFHDEDKSGDLVTILYHSVANVNYYLYILVLFSHNLSSIVLSCKPLFL